MIQIKPSKFKLVSDDGLWLVLPGLLTSDTDNINSTQKTMATPSPHGPTKTHWFCNDVDLKAIVTMKQCSNVYISRLSADRTLLPTHSAASLLPGRDFNCTSDPSLFSFMCPMFKWSPLVCCLFLLRIDILSIDPS